MGGWVGGPGSSAVVQSCYVGLHSWAGAGHPVFSASAGAYNPNPCTPRTPCAAPQIKNRESAARSRAKRQEYTATLEQKVGNKHFFGCEGDILRVVLLVSRRQHSHQSSQRACVEGNLGTMTPAPRRCPPAEEPGLADGRAVQTAPL